jgi:hypothetical protein
MSFQQIAPFVQVSDADASAAVFCGALAFEVLWEYQPEPTYPKVICVQRDAVRLYLTEIPESAAGAKYFIWVDNLGAVRAQATQSALEHEIDEHGHFGQPELRFHDPDGNFFCIAEQDR